MPPGMPDAPLHLPVLYSTVREGRESIHVARWVHRQVEAREGVTTSFVDPRDLQLGHLVTRIRKLDDVPDHLAAWRDDMERADGFVVVTAEYNYGIPGALKEMLDHLYPEWNRKPFGLVGAGGTSGGLRAIDHLRQVVTGVEGVVVPRHVHVRYVKRTFGEDGPVEDPERWTKRLDGFLDEVAWYARVLRAGREGE